MRPVGGLPPAAGFDPAHHRQQFGRSDLANRQGADPGEDVALEAAQDLLGVAWRPAGGELGEPLARARLEAVRIPRRPVLRQLAECARVDTLRPLAARFLALFTRTIERGFVGAIGSKGQRFLFAAEAVGQAPPLATGRLYQQKQAAAVGQLVGRDLRVGVLDRVVGQLVGGGHCWYVALLVGELPTKLSANAADVDGYGRTTADASCRKKLLFTVAYGLGDSGE